MFANRCLILLFAIFSLLNEANCDFPSDFLGNTLNDEDYEKQDFCSTRVCLLDSGRLIYSASHNSSSVLPCTDFKNFAMGEFITHRVPNDRYPAIGFQNDVRRVFEEKQKQILNSAIKPDEPRVFKVMKSSFQKCVDSKKVNKEGPREVISFLNERGGKSPLTTSGNFDEATFDLETLLKLDSNLSWSVFFYHQLTLFKHGSKKILRLKFFRHWLIDFNPSIDLPILDNSRTAEALKNVEDFKALANQTVAKFANINSSEILKIGDLGRRFPSLKVNWTNVINSELLDRSRKTDDDEILIEKPELLDALFQNFASLDNKTKANLFSAYFLMDNRNFYVVYGFADIETEILGTVRDLQRFESCLRSTSIVMKEAFDALMSHTLHSSMVEVAMTPMIQEAINDVKQEIEKNELLKSNEAVRTAILEKLSTIKLFPKQIYDIARISKLFEELRLDGTESFLNMEIELWKHSYKLELEDRFVWTKKHVEEEGWVRDDTVWTPFFVENNILIFPTVFSQYPFFHPDRSRFFNTVTLYMETVNVLKQEIDLMVEQKNNITGFSLPSAVDFAYQNYLKWEANGGQEKKLSSFKLNSHQMFWVCLAHVTTAKYHRNVSKDDISRKLEDKFTNEYFKSFKGFRDDFKCGINVY